MLPVIHLTSLWLPAMSVSSSKGTSRSASNLIFLFVLFIYLFYFIYLARVTYNQVQPLRINYLATEFLPKLELYG